MAGTELSLLLKLGSSPKFSEFAESPVIQMIVRRQKQSQQTIFIRTWVLSFGQDDDNEADIDDDDNAE